MKLYRTTKGILIDNEDDFHLIEDDWDGLINRDSLFEHLKKLTKSTKSVSRDLADSFLKNILAPINKQEVWAAGVTYLRSRDARMEESKNSGGATLYDHVYEAERPELFFKAIASRVAAHNEAVHIRRDSAWNVPEPELTLFINLNGNIQGYTIGNDMSSRSIEGENALYLPQAKIYQRSASLGPCQYVPNEPLPSTTKISMQIVRNEKTVFEDSVPISQIKRSFDELKTFLFRECDFEYGVFLMTGTSVVPGDGFTLQEKDVVNISIDHIGTLTNFVATKI